MEVHQGWDQNGKKATVIRVSRHVANYWSAWDSSMANPQTLFDAERAFGSMLTTARKVVRGFETGTPIEADDVTAPIRNLYAWHSTCKRFVESKRVALRTARSKIPSPADYQGIVRANNQAFQFIACPLLGEPASEDVPAHATSAGRHGPECSDPNAPSVWPRSNHPVQIATRG